MMAEAAPTPDAEPRHIAVSRQSIELLEDLVVSLNRTHWSSWQATASFWKQKEAAEQWLQAIGRKTE
jgi:hypothetical protein